MIAPLQKVVNQFSGAQEESLRQFVQYVSSETRNMTSGSSTDLYAQTNHRYRYPARTAVRV